MDGGCADYLAPVELAGFSGEAGNLKRGWLILVAGTGVGNER